MAQCMNRPKPSETPQLCSKPARSSQMIPGADGSTPSGDCGKKACKDNGGNGGGHQRNCQKKQSDSMKPQTCNSTACKGESGRQPCPPRGPEQSRRQLSYGSVDVAAPECQTNRKPMSKLDVGSENRCNGKPPARNNSTNQTNASQTLKVSNFEKLVIQPGSPTVIEVCSATNNEQNSQYDTDSCDSSNDSNSNCDSEEGTPEGSTMNYNAGIGDGACKSDNSKSEPPTPTCSEKYKTSAINPKCQEILDNIEKNQQKRNSSQCQEMPDNDKSKQRKSLSQCQEMSKNRQKNKVSQEMVSPPICNGNKGSPTRNSGNLQVCGNKVEPTQCNNGAKANACSSGRTEAAQANKPNDMGQSKGDTKPSCNCKSNRQADKGQANQSKQCQSQTKRSECSQSRNRQKPSQKNGVTENQNTPPSCPAPNNGSAEISPVCSTNKAKKVPNSESTSNIRNIMPDASINQYLKVTNLDTVIIQPGMPTVIQVCQGRRPQDSQYPELEQNDLADKSKSDCSVSSNGCDCDQDNVTPIDKSSGENNANSCAEEGQTPKNRCDEWVSPPQETGDNGEQAPCPCSLKAQPESQKKSLSGSSGQPCGPSQQQYPAPPIQQRPPRLMQHRCGQQSQQASQQLGQQCCTSQQDGPRASLQKRPAQNRGRPVPEQMTRQPKQAPPRQSQERTQGKECRLKACQNKPPQQPRYPPSNLQEMDNQFPESQAMTAECGQQQYGAPQYQNGFSKNKRMSQSHSQGCPQSTSQLQQQGRKQRNKAPCTSTNTRQSGYQTPNQIQEQQWSQNSCTHHSQTQQYDPCQSERQEQNCTFNDNLSYLSENKGGDQMYADMYAELNTLDDNCYDSNAPGDMNQFYEDDDFNFAESSNYNDCICD